MVSGSDLNSFYVLMVSLQSLGYGINTHLTPHWYICPQYTPCCFRIKGKTDFCMNIGCQHQITLKIHLASCSASDIGQNQVPNGEYKHWGNIYTFLPLPSLHCLGTKKFQVTVLAIPMLAIMATCLFQGLQEIHHSNLTRHFTLTFSPKQVSCQVLRELMLLQVSVLNTSCATL